ncbi:hypothetical protein BDV96DRAFT_503311 [Lophiotrema nucula]|uniref:LCCL domain-containing protein n=1 Tax=Lophiotrema nucula TaxID=690887 RepID=A0A6A5YRQ5_9PLEO|nr:hypothetical protein BDV96DRAFT_503311 [Lophiotrema nucula]
MTTSQRQPKQQEAAIRDVENGDDEISRDPSSLRLDVESSKSPSPRGRRSLEYFEADERPGSQTPGYWRAAHQKLPSIPTPVAHRWRQVTAWIKGPQPPQKYAIKPLFEAIQAAPIRLLSHLPRYIRLALFVCAFALWVAIFVTILSKDSLPSNIGGFGAPVRLSCIARLWPDSPSCGLDGRNCLPFDDQSFAFNCPSDCGSAQVLNPRTIGDQQIIYRTLVVGGTPDASEAGHDVYRGDSFICGAAIHAGLFDDDRGGCGVLSLLGEKSTYSSIDRNGIASLGFNSSFPLSFGFNQSQVVLDDGEKCRDPRWNVLIVSVIFTTLISVVTTSPLLFFGSIFIITYFQVALASDPPSFDTYASAVSIALGSFLPAAFTAVLIYRYCVRKTLAKLTAQVEKTVLWIGGLWVGALSNMTLEMIPIQRLTSHDLKQQPGAIIALVIIVIIILVIALYQAWCFRMEGRLSRYLALYAALGTTLLVMLSIPGLALRIHHYILALLLLPGTSLQTRPSLLWQALLVGLFINGIARWGFASILQTNVALRGDAQLGQGIPTILEPVINNTNITFVWERLLRGWDGVSVLVNDVERFRDFHLDGDGSFTWARRALDHPEYFRFGFVNYLPFGGVVYSDFTKAGIWWPNGSWTSAPPGVS